MSKQKLSFATALEGAGYALEALVRVGLVSSSAIAALLGQFVLAAVLGIVAVGMFLRLWRGRVHK